MEVGFCRRKNQVLKSAVIRTPPARIVPHGHRDPPVLLFFCFWVDSPDPDGGVSRLPVPPAAAYGNRDRMLLPTGDIVEKDWL